MLLGYVFTVKAVENIAMAYLNHDYTIFNFIYQGNTLLEKKLFSHKDHALLRAFVPSCEK